jgi:recombination protein RecR
MSLPLPLRRVVEQFSRLPGIGEKTATRLAFFLLRAEEETSRSLAEAVAALKGEICLCANCLSFSDVSPCAICGDPARSEETVCVVEDPADVMAIERAGDFRGKYHVLHGVLAPLDGIGLVKRGTVRELILAVNPTVEGEATAMALARLTKPLGLKVTRIAHGLPMGADVEYADGVTLSRALEGRREM